jgi:ribonuclease HII
MLSYLHEGAVEAGCDEAGRGPLAGAVFAAAVILPDGFFDARLKDSKQMSAKDRDAVREVIEREAVAWAVEEVSPEEIDKLNILWASVTGMQRAVLKLKVKPEWLLIDGNKWKPMEGYKAITIVHGDAVYASIAAASVLAKTHRDEYMRKLALEYPQYAWDKNFGYPTPEHIEALRRYGPTPYHRKSFHAKALDITLF